MKRAALWADAEPDAAEDIRRAAYERRRIAKERTLIAEAFEEIRREGDAAASRLAAFEAQFAKLPKIARIISKLTKRCTSETKPNRTVRVRLLVMEQHRTVELHRAWVMAREFGDPATFLLTSWVREEEPQRRRADFEMTAAQLRGGWWKPQHSDFDWRVFTRADLAYATLDVPGRDVERVVGLWNEHVEAGLPPVAIKRLIERDRESRARAARRQRAKAKVEREPVLVAVNTDFARAALAAWLATSPDKRTTEKLVGREAELLTLHAAYRACLVQLHEEPTEGKFKAQLAVTAGGAELANGSRSSLRKRLELVKKLHGATGPWVNI